VCTAHSFCICHVWALRTGITGILWAARAPLAQHHAGAQRERAKVRVRCGSIRALSWRAMTSLANLTCCWSSLSSACRHKQVHSWEQFGVPRGGRWCHASGAVTAGSIAKLMGYLLSSVSICRQRSDIRQRHPVLAPPLAERDRRARAAAARRTHSM